MRIQEYRAYLKAENKIYRVISLHDKFKDEEFNRVFLERPIGKEGITNYQVDGENVILMQYIGINDNTGKKYFDGDVFEFDDGDRGYIELDCGEFCVRRIGDWKCEHYTYPLYKIEVAKIIGNVYQNETLLTKNLNKWYDINLYTEEDMKDGEHNAIARTHIFAKSLEEAINKVKNGYVEIERDNKVYISNLKNNKFNNQ